MNRSPFRMTLILSVLFLLVVVGSAVVLAQGEPASVDAAKCVPKTKEVVVFEGANYTGKCAKMKIGTYANPAAMKIANDSISSIKVGSLVRAVAFEHIDFAGDVSGFPISEPNLATDPDPTPIGDNRISSMKVELKPKTGCNPRPNEIAVFEDSNYGGQCMIHNAGNFRGSVEMGLSLDVISSVKVGNLLRVVFYQDEFFTGSAGAYTANDPWLGDDPIGNDTVSSFQVDLKAKAGNCKPKPTQVALFVDAQYKGQCIIKEIGEYRNPMGMGIAEDTITSFKIGSKVKLILYTSMGWTGDSATFTTNVNDLATQPIGDNRTSSFKIVSR